MYYLVKFEDEVYYICNKSRIVLKDNSVSVKYTGGGWYPATIIDCHDDKSLLVETKTKLEKCSKNDDPQPLVVTVSCENSKKGNLNNNSEFIKSTNDNTIKEIKSVSTKMGKREDTELILTASCENPDIANVCENFQFVDDYMTKTKSVATEIERQEDTELILTASCENPDIANVCENFQFVDDYMTKTKSVATEIEIQEDSELLLTATCKNPDVCVNSEFDHTVIETAATEKGYIELRDTEPIVIATYEKPDIVARAILNLDENQEMFSENVRNSVDNEGEHEQEFSKKSGHKQHSCVYCKKVIYQLPRHWFQIHFREPEVREIMSLNSKNPERKMKIDNLRKKGDYKFNQETDDSKNIVLRRGIADNKDYRPCPSCLGYFRKDNLRHHRKRCSPKKGDRALQGNSIKLTNYIHSRASNMLRNEVASHMFKDEISKHFLFDEIIIVYGNFLCLKYTESHLKTHIRAQLRLLGRFMQQCKLIDQKIQCCKDLMHPACIDTIRMAIDAVAEFTPESGVYKHPTNARTLGTEFKKILEVVLSESDKNLDEQLRKLTKALTRRYNLELAPYLNRVCKLSENRYKRLKPINNLPENKQIEDYLNYLTSKSNNLLNTLKTGYNFNNWNQLCECLLVTLAVFNRKRPGETQRIELEDFYKKECVSEQDLINLSEEEKIQAEKYIRVTFRGKLGNNTALLMDKHKFIPSLEIILKYRLKAGVHPDNPFLFGFPSKDKNLTYCTYRCHRQFLEESGMNSSSLTFTNLRKHFATQVAKGGISHQEELRVSNYMSHKYSLHKTVYDQSTPLVDITTVSQHLERSAKTGTKDKHTIKRGIEDESTLQLKKKQKTDSDSHEEYEPDNNESDEIDPDPDLTMSYAGKFKRRKLWSTKEKHVTRTYFHSELENDGYISPNKIRKLKNVHSEILQHRSIPMIKQWLEGEKEKKKTRADGIEATRLRYSTPERELLEKSLEHHSLNGSEPSIEELENLIKENSIIKRRSTDSLLRKFKYIQASKNR